MSIYDTLNDRQQEAVFHTEGPLLILAGAGSGKTPVSYTHLDVYKRQAPGCAMTPEPHRRRGEDGTILSAQKTNTRGDGIRCASPGCGV